MATHDIRTADRDSLARFLGWLSIGLGLTELLAPRAIEKVIGGGDARFIRLMGLRELAHGAGIIARARPTGFTWSRVAGDALDVATLGAVAQHGNKRTFVVIAQLVPVAVADLVEARKLSQRQGDPQGGKRIREAVTIAKPRLEVEQAWTPADDLRPKVDGHGAQVSFLEEDDCLRVVLTP